jgi:Zn-dependent peptidase ImmA (M78 family)
MPPEEPDFSKPFIVWLIINRQTEEALHLLANQYKVKVPRLKVGLPKGHKKKALGVYQSRDETIFILNSDILGNPFVILHEFYHHLRSKAVDKRHRGTEKNADRFATEFLTEFQKSAGRFTR